MVRLDGVKYNNILLSTNIVSDVSELVCPGIEGGIYIVYNDKDFYSSEVYIFKDNFFEKLKDERTMMLLDEIDKEIKRGIDEVFPPQ